MSTPTLRELVAQHGEAECARLLGVSTATLRRKLDELGRSLTWSAEAAETVARTTVAISAGSNLPAMARRAVELLIEDADGHARPLEAVLGDLGHMLGICKYADTGDTLTAAWLGLANATPTAEQPGKRHVDGKKRGGKMAQSCLDILKALGDEELTSAQIAAKVGAADGRSVSANLGNLTRYGYVESLGGGVMRRTDKAVPA